MSMPRHSVRFGSTCQYRYDDSGFIGQGSFGNTCTAKITQRGNYVGADVVAVRCFSVMEQAFLDNPDNYAKLQERFHTMLQLKHNHLVDYHQITIIPNIGAATIEFMMDYYPGGNLQTKLERVKDSGILLDVRSAISHALDFADGLAFLHEKGITHGDLKPENVLVDVSSAQDQSETSLRIADWDSLATVQRCSVSSLSGKHSRGSERYMSPEMLAARGPMVTRFTWPRLPGPATDLWSAGCILLQLVRAVTGDYCEILRHPVSGQVRGADRSLKNMAFSAAVMQGFIPVDPTCASIYIPAELTAGIRQCLCTAADQRITAAQLLDHLSSASGNCTSSTR
ncbi:uncharacterized protein LOC129598318 [Paramacrobiotus metropolitanus]|uniref:uncharacterized protein LOC129598318 n=1 Tax=Paramacrobiotus metropolitanus TaxID=2943436 RepID=UPI002445C591|nr:uncharacterized protein LOC129598318 [Paramacrobiotus metropolitanus]